MHQNPKYIPEIVYLVRLDNFIFHEKSFTEISAFVDLKTNRIRGMFDPWNALMILKVFPKYFL